MCPMGLRRPLFLCKTTFFMIHISHWVFMTGCHVKFKVQIVLWRNHPLFCGFSMKMTRTRSFLQKLNICAQSSSFLLQIDIRHALLESSVLEISVKNVKKSGTNYCFRIESIFNLILKDWLINSSLKKLYTLTSNK